MSSWFNGQIGPSFRVGTPVWAYGVKTEEDLQAMLISFESEVPTLRRFDSLANALEAYKVFESAKQKPFIIPYAETSQEASQ